jgi:protein-tyrosine phosphatase
VIDLHCHILPGLDDGACDLDDALAMARSGRDDGIEAICATPHIRADHAVVIDGLSAHVDRLGSAVSAAGIAVAILPGAEVAAAMLGELSEVELGLVSLGGSRRWILLEPDPGPLDGRLDDAVERLRRYGYRAVVAHPERHPGADLEDRLRRLVLRGALVQGTADFLLRETTRQGMLSLARAGLIHVLGSDAHSSRVGRPVSLSTAYDTLAAVEPMAGHLEWVAETAPQAIVRGEELTPPFSPR